MSLVVVVTALPARLAAVPLGDLTDRWSVVANLLVGSLVGAWVGATWATRMRSGTLYRVLAALLVLIAVALVVCHAGPVGSLDLSPVLGTVVGGLLAGLAPEALLVPLLAVLLLASAVKVWRHDHAPSPAHGRA